MFFCLLVTFSPVLPHFVKVLQPICLVIIPGKATFAAALSNKCLVATREEEGHFQNRKVLLLYFFYYQISQICKGMKVIAITPHFVRYAIRWRITILNEVWVVIAGEGETVVDGMRQSIHTGDVITMVAGCRHTVSATTELRLIEVQLGKEISVTDKKKYNE